MDPNVRAFTESRKKKHPFPLLNGHLVNEDSAGHVVMGDQHSTGNDWGHHASQVAVIGEYLYLPTIAGTVYVIVGTVTYSTKTQL